MNAGVALQKTRRAARLSQRALAARSGVPQSTIARIESGAITPRVDTLENILQACGYRLTLSRLGEGVDRTMIRELLKLSPAERLELAVREAHNLEEFLAAVRR